jgi:spore maturation protein CgeB
MHPNTDLGAHERFFLALGAGSMPVTDRNTYIEQAFPELLPYTFDFTPGSVTAALERVVENPKVALELARATRERARPIYGMEQTAAKIVEVMQSAAFVFAAPKPEQNFFVP